MSALQSWAKRPNRRRRAAALREAHGLLAEAHREQARALAEFQSRAAQSWRTASDALYGAHKYGRNPDELVFVPHRRLTGAPPGDGLEFVRNEGGHWLWDGTGWVSITESVMRDPANSHLRTTWARACAQQAVVARLSDTSIRLRNGVIVRVLPESLEDHPPMPR